MANLKPLALACLLWSPFVAMAQPLLRLGMTVVTHMPADTNSENVVQVFDTRNVAVAATQGSNWSATSLLPPSPADAAQWKFSRMGSVFGTTIDGDGNFYVAASVVYYGATWTNPFGTAGAGGIYRVNANDWSVSDFVVTDPNQATTSTTMIPNTGCGLGNITYDKWHNQLFATNFEDGKIYRIDMNGTILSTFDPHAADDGSVGIAPVGEILWGVGVYQDTMGNGRVYFGNWSARWSLAQLPAPFDKNTIWSVALDANGEFAGTEQLEYTVADLPSALSSPVGSPVSCINFSSGGTMLVTERTMYDFYSSAHESRVYTLELAAGIWSLLRLYNIGVIGLDMGLASNTAGGADFAYLDSDPGDSLNGSEELIWATGDAIKFSNYNPDQSMDHVYGIAGLPASGNSADPVSPDFVYVNSYMVDLNNDVTDIPKTQIGSCAVLRDYEFDPCENYECSLVNVFTPNNDSRNDLLAFDCIYGKDWKLEVFNRWGDRVYASNNYLNDWNGDQLSEGVYYYILTSPCDGHTGNGFFHLLRTEQ